MTRETSLLVLGLDMALLIERQLVGIAQIVEMTAAHIDALGTPADPPHLPTCIKDASRLVDAFAALVEAEAGWRSRGGRLQ